MPLPIFVIGQSSEEIACAPGVRAYTVRADTPLGVEHVPTQRQRSMMGSHPSDALLEQIAVRFKLLSEPLRLKLLTALEDGERNVGELVVVTGAGQANVSKHLAALAQAGLVRRRKVGTSIYYAIADESAFTLCDVVCAGLRQQIATQAQSLGVGGER